jgi:hypothetical protein
MPDQEHLILVLARDAEEITRDISVFFAPTRDFIEPGADWPQDLTRAELAALIPYLRRTIGSLSDVITHVIADNRADPEKARVAAEGVRMIEQGEEARRAGETLFGAPPSPPGTRSQQDMAAQDFPDGAATGPASGPSLAAPEVGLAVPSRPGNNHGPGTRHPR